MVDPVVAQSAIAIGEAFKTGVNVAGMIQRSDSLVSYTQDCRIEPITLIDEKVMYLPFLGDILQTANSIFAGYYLQAVSLDATIGSVNVLKRLDKFNPTRSPYLHSFEDFQEGLPRYGIEAMDDYGNEIIRGKSIGNPTDWSKLSPSEAMELASKDPAKAAEYQRYIRKNLHSKGSHDSVGGDVRAIKDANNMAVGKLIEVELVHNDKTLRLPIAIRLNTKTVDTQSLLHILGNSKDNKSAKERYHGWRSGELQFWRDIVLCEDLIKAHRTTLAKDKSGIYAEIMNRKNGNALATVMSKELSVGSASAITIMSDSTRKELEYQIGGKLSDMRVRNRIFQDTYMMLMFIVDAEYEHVTIYHRGLNMSTDMSVKEMKIASKNESGMITDVLKSFISGHAPSF